jgi:hypothetical protein
MLASAEASGFGFSGGSQQAYAFEPDTRGVALAQGRGPTVRGCSAFGSGRSLMQKHAVAAMSDARQPANHSIT